VGVVLDVAVDRAPECVEWKGLSPAVPRPVTQEGLPEEPYLEAPTGSPVKIGDDTIISHGAMVHGATIGSNVLVGIGAIVLDKARVGDGAIVGSGALVSPGKEVPDNMLAIGIPAKPLREVRDGEREMVAKEHERTNSKAEKYKKIFG